MTSRKWAMLMTSSSLSSSFSSISRLCKSNKMSASWVRGPVDSSVKLDGRKKAKNSILFFWNCKSMKPYKWTDKCFLIDGESCWRSLPDPFVHDGVVVKPDGQLGRILKRNPFPDSQPAQRVPDEVRRWVVNLDFKFTNQNLMATVPKSQTVLHLKHIDYKMV